MLLRTRFTTHTSNKPASRTCEQNTYDELPPMPRQSSSMVLIVVILNLVSNSIRRGSICSTTLSLLPPNSGASCVVVSLATKRQSEKCLKSKAEAHEHLFRKQEGEEVLEHSCVRSRSSSRRFGLSFQTLCSIWERRQRPYREDREEESFDAKQELEEAVIEVRLGHVCRWRGSASTFRDAYDD